MPREELAERIKGVHCALVTYCNLGGQPGGGGIGGCSWIGVPLDGTYNEFLRNDGFRLLTDIFWSMKVRERQPSHSWDLDNRRW